MTRTKSNLLLALFGIIFPYVCLGQEAGYPKAEWTRARAILMHTPGEELFDGVIHPTAGLFEHYFDVDLAAAEHDNYVRMLQDNGISVYKVKDVLMSIDIDTLRSLASQVLRYDLTDVVPADTASNGEAYRLATINKMSRADLVRVLLFQPTVKMRSVNNNTGIEATYTHRSLMNLYFTRDQSITTPRGLVICNMNSLQRAPETRIIKACYRHLGLSPIFEVTGDGRLEGGDYIPAGNVAFIGKGMRTNQEAIRQIMEADAFGHDTIVVVNDHLHWQMEMHLDTHFNIIDRDLCTMPESRLNAKQGDSAYVTVDIYARQPGAKAYTLVSQDQGFVDYVRSRGFTIIPISRADELHYANNYLTIAPRHIMAVEGQTQAYQNALAAHGVTVEWIPLDNLVKGYGAAHCMTQVMQRDFTSASPVDSVYDGLYNRPTHFPDFVMPSDWPSTMTYFVCASLDGGRLHNYEVAVYDQNGNLRQTGRSIASQQELCTLTIPGDPGDTFHFKVIYGDFDNPVIVDVPETCEFVANDNVGNMDYPFWLTIKTSGVSLPQATQKEAKTDVTYTVSGMRVQGEPTRPGVYINKGKKTVKR